MRELPDTKKGKGDIPASLNLEFGKAMRPAWLFWNSCNNHGTEQKTRGAYRRRNRPVLGQIGCARCGSAAREGQGGFPSSHRRTGTGACKERKAHQVQRKKAQPEDILYPLRIYGRIAQRTSCSSLLKASDRGTKKSRLGHVAQEQAAQQNHQAIDD